MKAKGTLCSSARQSRRCISMTLLASPLALWATGRGDLFAGKWAGRLNDLPGVDLELYDSSGALQGKVVFYFQQREEGKWRVAGQNEVTMLAPRVSGKTLRFEVSRAKKAGGLERGSNAKYRMELTGPNEAALFTLGERMPAIQLLRR